MTAPNAYLVDGFGQPLKYGPVLGPYTTLAVLNASRNPADFPGLTALAAGSVYQSNGEVWVLAGGGGGTLGSALPIINGTAAAGSASAGSHEDHVHPTDTSRAALSSPTFTGTPAAPTAAADTNTTQVATTAFVVGQASSTNPVMDGSVAIGTSLKYARADHVHASDTTKVSVSAIVNDLTTGGTTVPLSAEQGKTLQAAKADYKAIRDETASFTISAANHANRLTDYNSGSAGVATVNTGHGCTAGDSGTFIQYGAGALTITAGTATVTLAPGVATAATVGVGSTIDWVYKGADVFYVVSVGIASTTAGRSMLTAADAVAQRQLLALAPVAVSGSKTLASTDNGIPQFTTTTSRAFTVPPSMPADYAVPIYGPCTFVDGSGVTATANDYRVAGATLGKEFCLLQQTPTANTYFITGSKV